MTALKHNSVMNKLLALNRLRWYARLPIKWAIFALTVMAVCFPNPALLVRHLGHWQDLDALVEPRAPALQPLVEELRATMPKDLAPTQALRFVEGFVYEKIEYAWDWDTWGNADYLPTVTEVIEKGREDCDGRAVLSASLLENFGFDASLVTDFTHMWVKTEAGETMGPGKRVAIEATEKGLRIRPGAFSELFKAQAVGVAVFPIPRELIILAMLWLLLLRQGGGVACSLTGLALFLGGLFALRWSAVGWRDPDPRAIWSGVAALATGLIVMLAWGKYNALRTECTSNSGETTVPLRDAGM